MKRVTVVFAAGLSRRFLERDTMPWLSTTHDPRHLSELAPTFPCLPDVVRYCALSGQLPSAHGCVLSADLPRASETRVPGEEFETQLRVVEEGRLLMEARVHGLSSEARKEAALELDETLRRLFEADDQKGLLLVAGLSQAQSAAERIEWKSLPHEEDGSVAVESALLRARVSEPSRLSSLREALLRTRGVERVLHGEALTAFGVAAEGGTQLLALARAGFSFVDERAAVGNLEGAPGEESVLLALGSRAQESWPATLHALRIAPSLARFLGRAESRYADRPFAL